MTLVLDPASEQRIQREIERGHYRETAEVVAHALALLEAQDNSNAATLETAGEAADSPRYTYPMTLTLDPTTEQRIQREIERGHYREPAEVIARGIALLEDEEEWLQSNKEAINERLDESYAQVQRGEGIPEGQVRAILAQDRVDRRK